MPEVPPTTSSDALDREHLQIQARQQFLIEDGHLRKGLFTNWSL
jgi:hypothetical protein